MNADTENIEALFNLSTELEYAAVGKSNTSWGAGYTMGGSWHRYFYSINENLLYTIDYYMKSLDVKKVESMSAEHLT